MPDTTTTAPSRAAARVKRLDGAKTEYAALRAWRDAGADPSTRPATPTLEAIERGEKLTMTTTKTTKTTDAPAAGKAQQLIELRNTTHGATVAAALGKGRSSSVSGNWLVVEKAEAQAVLDDLIAAQAGATEFQNRILNLASVQLRLAFPRLTDPRATAVAKLTTAVLKAKLPTTVTARPDSTPAFTIDGTEYTTLRAALAHPGLDVDTKPAAATKAQPAAKAPKTAKAPATKRATAKAPAKSAPTSRRRNRTTDASVAMARATEAKRREAAAAASA